MSLLFGPPRETFRGATARVHATLHPMISRGVLYPFAALFSFGCADMLGLGGLTYDQGEGETTVRTGGAPENSGGTPEGAGGSVSGDGGVHTSLGGGSNGATSGVSFLLLDREAQVAALPLPNESPGYFVFEPSSQELSRVKADGTGSEVLATWDWPALDGFSHLAAVPFSEGITLIGYDRASGSTSQAILQGEGDFQILANDIGTSGRTALLPLFTGAEWLAFVYSASNGNYRYFRPLPAEDAALFAGSSEPGWTSIERFVNGDDVGVLKHNEATRLLQFDRFVALGAPLSSVFTLELDRAFSHMVTFGGDSVLLYQAGSGLVVTGKIVEEQGSVSFVETQKGYFRGDLSQIEPLSGDIALTFSSASGRAVVRTLDPLENDPAIPVR